MYSFAINADYGLPSVRLLMKENALIAGFVVTLGAAIVCVLGPRRGSKIDPSVIGPNAIDVINVMIRPLAGHQEPHHSMRTIKAIIKADKTIAAAR